MGEEQDYQTQRLQSIVDRTKTLSLLNNVHNLVPPVKKDEANNEILIITALSSEPRLQDIYLECRGQIMGPGGKVEQIANPIMNIQGSWKLVSELKKIAREAEFGNFQEEFIPAYLDHFFREIFPYFTFWHEDYELEPKDFDYVKVTLQMFILSSFYKGKGGKYINLVGRTYSEDTLGKIMNYERQPGKKAGFLDNLNPFRKIQ